MTSKSLYCHTSSGNILFVFCNNRSSFIQTKIEVRRELSLSKFCCFHYSIFIDLTKIMHKLLEISGIIFGSNICTTVIFPHSCNKYLWKIFLSNLEIYITIVSFEKTVVFWVMLFYQVIFQKKCF